MFFNDKTIAWFDIWSFEHFISGMCIGSILLIFLSSIQERLQDRKDIFVLLYVVSILMVGYMWETIEHYLEEGFISDQVTFWFHGVEYWANRIITDPLLELLGGMLVLYQPIFCISARVFSCLWLVVHVFIFPHSMYLQDLLSGLYQS